MSKEFKCPRCGYETDIKANLVAHLKSKKLCPVTFSNVTRESILEEYKKPERLNDAVACDWCKKEISKCNVSRHRQICPKRVDSNTSNNELTAMIEDKLQQMTTIMQEQGQEIASIKKKQIDILSVGSEVHNDALKFEEIIEQQNLEIYVLREELQNKDKVIHKQKLELAFLKKKKNEDFYQGIMEQHYNATHKTLECGITDVTTNDAHYEIKRWSCWKEALSQLILYNDDDPKEHMYACFFEICGEQQKKKVQSRFAKYNITCLEFREEKNSITLCDLESGEIKLTYTFPQAI